MATLVGSLVIEHQTAARAEDISVIMQFILDTVTDISYIYRIMKDRAPKEGRSHNRVKVARVATGLTQAQLAERVGVTRQTIGLIEAGGYNPTLNLCIRLAQVTDKTLDELFWIEGEN